MKSNGFTNEKGGAKKFLYTGPKKGNDDVEDDLPWNFNAKKQSNPGNQAGSKFELDNVWSIQRNVNISGGVKPPKADNSLHFNTSKSYYSRHGGGQKDDFGAAFGGSSTARNDNSGNTNNTAPGGKTWGMGNQTERRPFSYAYGNDLPSPSDKPISPRNISNSSAGIYPQTGGSHFGSQTGSGMTSGNLNSLRGGNFNKQGSGNFFSNENTDRLVSSSNNNSVFSKSLMSSSPSGASNSYNPTQRNSLFSSSAQKNQSQNGLFNGNNRPSFEGGATGRQNKSFW
ncbi:uncharacterized protein LOC132742587 isoform X2 [Ruditapes philippinarum]|uniref:uncharacterized protein LOC132742587 isoform X2 n=1 Tax=Ruditapes philippinarum TaxID=129788 RepID=UPI00295AF8F0|nr:uncharacterized protein LOC132742587 isoform X2 [Ruditapes philippinarum]